MAEEQPGRSEINPENSSQSDISAAVRINVEGKTSEVRIVAVNHLFADIAKYNEQFGLGSMMARLIISHRFEGEDKDPEDGAGNQLANEEEHQRMTASALVQIHKNTLDGIGLSLEPVSGKKATLIGLGEKAGEGEMRINIRDRNHFVSFLGGLEREQVETTGLKPNLENLSEILSKQVLDHYNLKEPGDEMLELFGGLGNIVSEYKRLGMGSAVGRLETYLDHGRRGDLREFVAVEGEELLSEPRKNFGPADWQRDASPKYLENRWSDAIGILKATKANPKARDLYNQLQKHLVKCIKIARNDSKSLSYYSTEHREQLSKILEDVHMKLEDLMIQ